MREYVARRAGDPARRGAARVGALPDQVRVHGLRGARRAADLRRRAVAEHDPARGRGRRRGDAVALLPRLHPRHGRPRARARASRRRGARATTSTSSPRSRSRSPTTPRRRGRALRQDLIPYASLPFYRAMLEASGFADELAAFDEGMAAGDLERAKAGLSDRMLGELAGIGSTADVHAAVRRYQDAGVNSPCDRRAPGHRLRRRARGGRRADLTAPNPVTRRRPPPSAGRRSVASGSAPCA